MVTDSGELQRLRERIDELAREAGRTEPIEVGVMIEVPSAATRNSSGLSPISYPRIRKSGDSAKSSASP